VEPLSPAVASATRISEAVVRPRTATRRCCNRSSMSASLPDGGWDAVARD
jgi:hypothetical protein